MATNPLNYPCPMVKVLHLFSARRAQVPKWKFYNAIPPSTVADEPKTTVAPSIQVFHPAFGQFV